MSTIILKVGVQVFKGGEGGRLFEKIGCIVFVNLNSQRDTQSL